MTVSTNTERLEADIQEEYERRLRRYPGPALGWRLLYSPRRVLSGARVAFIGFNPGGRYIDQTHGEFSAEAGSAYRKEVEDWNPSSSLQEQVMALFHRLDVEPEDVLAGNLVPFRSPSEDSLPGASDAVIFGKNLWTQILAVARPSLVVSMGAKTNREISRLLLVHDITKYPTGWGNYTASRGTFAGGTWIGLPHLSRFGIMKRSASQTPMDQLFRELN
ncbi:uracil-DNA glycosylase family protein [Roseovarius sp. D22-M7]|uniref:uracil-DNA glycosylase family protein n=1 Tax=Roseovarius sp. D22-M7 TaxID=3127116 RepID=UPI00300FEFC9